MFRGLAAQSKMLSHFSYLNTYACKDSHTAEIIIWRVKIIKRASISTRQQPYVSAKNTFNKNQALVKYPRHLRPN